MKHQLIILDASGDTRYEWHTQDGSVATLDAADERVLAEARSAFERHLAQGGMAFETTTARPEHGTVVKKFNAEAERTTLTPQFIGG